MLIGYARVSTNETGRDSTGLGAEDGWVRTNLPREGHRGRWNRPELQRLLDHLPNGDVLVVWKLDRLSRSLRDDHGADTRGHLCRFILGK